MVWCTLVVILFGDNVETAVKGNIISETKTTYTLDFQEYAKKQKYEGNYSSVVVNKEECIEE